MTLCPTCAHVRAVASPGVPVLVMGVLNVTPDSFSDGGESVDASIAIARGQQMIDDGASIIDVGGESTRPGADTVSVDEELARVLPVVEYFGDKVRVSIDTSKVEVAEAAVRAGATLINDVSASLDALAADLGVGWVAMHMQGRPRTMQVSPTYVDVVSEVRDFLLATAERAADRGVREIWIDPGIGFGKTTEHNLALLRHLSVLTASSFPVLVGTSRKSFLGKLTGEAPPSDRLAASLTTALWSVAQGAAAVRVHDVRDTVRSLRVAEAIGGSALGRAALHGGPVRTETGAA